MLVLSDDAEALERERAGLAARFPEVAPEWLEGAALADAEPGLGDGLCAYRLATGRPVPPAAAAAAWAERARAAGAELRIGVAVEARRARRRARDRRAHGRTGTEPAGAVAIAAGPWTRRCCRNARRATASRAVGRQRGGAAGRAAATRARAGGHRRADQRRRRRPGVALQHRHGGRRVGRRLDVPARGAGSRRRSRRCCSSAARATCPRSASPGAFSARACPRPQSRDGLPLLGPCGEVEGLHVASGHGAWGISLGPGSAELVAAAILGDGGAIPPELAARRVLQSVLSSAASAKPSVVTTPVNGERPSASYASGNIVSASMVRIAPAANAWIPATHSGDASPSSA